jgi:hypothetical protein
MSDLKKLLTIKQFMDAQKRLGKDIGQDLGLVDKPTMENPEVLPEDWNAHDALITGENIPDGAWVQGEEPGPITAPTPSKSKMYFPGKEEFEDGGLANQLSTKQGRKDYIYKKLKDLGFSDVYAVGFLANMDIESAYSFHPHVRQHQRYNEKTEKLYYPKGKKQGPGGGLVQWEAPRRKQLNAFAKNIGKNPWSDNLKEAIDTQLEFIKHEITNDPYEKNKWKEVIKANPSTPEEAAMLIEEKYERAGNPLRKLRKKSAEKYTNEYIANKSAPIDFNKSDIIPGSEMKVLPELQFPTELPPETKPVENKGDSFRGPTHDFPGLPKQPIDLNTGDPLSDSTLPEQDMVMRKKEDEPIIAQDGALGYLNYPHVDPFQTGDAATGTPFGLAKPAEPTLEEEMAAFPPSPEEPAGLDAGLQEKKKLLADLNAPKEPMGDPTIPANEPVNTDLSAEQVDDLSSQGAELPGVEIKKSSVEEKKDKSGLTPTSKSIEKSAGIPGIAKEIEKQKSKSIDLKTEYTILMDEYKKAQKAKDKAREDKATHDILQSLVDASRQYAVGTARIAGAKVQDAKKGKEKKVDEFYKGPDVEILKSKMALLKNIQGKGANKHAYQQIKGMVTEGGDMLAFDADNAKPINMRTGKVHTGKVQRSYVQTFTDPITKDKYVKNIDGEWERATRAGETEVKKSEKIYNQFQPNERELIDAYQKQFAMDTRDTREFLK